MKWIEWLGISLLIVIGLSCLTVSATTFMIPDSMHMYLGNLMQICMWVGIPAIIVILFYLIFKWNRRR